MEHITSTTYLPAAAFAVAHGNPLPRLKAIGSDGSRFEFFFDSDPDDEIASLIRDYFKGASVPGVEFFRALQDLRFAINRAKHGGAR
jgi:hypothetical protein